MYLHGQHELQYTQQRREGKIKNYDHSGGGSAGNFYRGCNDLVKMLLWR
jgi:hypothetical protein